MCKTKSALSQMRAFILGYKFEKLVEHIRGNKALRSIIFEVSKIFVTAVKKYYKSIKVKCVIRKKNEK